MQREAIQIEILLQKNVIKLTHPYRVRWDLLVMALAIFTSFTVPFEFAFLEHDVITWRWKLFNLMIDLLFCIDIVLNFFTTAIDPVNGTEIDEKKEIAIHYLTG